MKVKDPTVEYVTRALQSSFSVRDRFLRVDVRRRRKDGGYNIHVSYSHVEGSPRITADDVYRVLNERLVRLVEGKETKMTMEETKNKFAVKPIFCMIGATLTGSETIAFSVPAKSA